MDKKKQVKRIFDSIAYRYDFLNHFLSVGIDIYWRKKSLKLSEINRHSVLLDVACGTGDFAIEARKLGVKNITGADLSYNMLKFFNAKSEWSRGNIIQCVAENLPFNSGTFTHITVAFGVRNFFDIAEAFKNFNTVLKDGGKAIVLEFQLPKNIIIRKGYLFYFNKVLPAIGKLISKDKEAYTYLPESVNQFDSNVNLVKLFKEAGFDKVSVKSLTFGIAQITIAEK
ncbi:MAG: bifunctional demethylmenaquinone methyltransferase/2-methoxy-6-polyprenyl-1,4-benzoquinol methylase UbiE [Ignavibacteriae bacterium HGW-Ignavibacteriae-2]|jgi:demethylmenaquinone methyltransferase/2-methoxy-6-polyprenyl-1,4-benzoquinol methylase|nr:MAG: bifunctional demethylmenaquinone methyltransferase/2-methoxy-6-polyprenyl-1,4-benzoquinol methylase UbiE [Ignavibacteriae bacterium HGW-Ignavibacteriae-2]